MAETKTPSQNAVGGLLRQWRRCRGMSQLDLSLAAEVSSRHLSFLETGRSAPSQKMLLRLSEVLDIPLRERNLMLHSAGFAHAYEESDLETPELASAARVLQLMLDHHEPYPAVVVDRFWNLRRFNLGALRWVQLFVEPDYLTDPVRHNAVRLVFDPGGLRPFITNWNEVASSLVQRLHRDLLSDRSEEYRALVDETLASPDIPDEWRVPDWTRSPEPLLPIALKKDAWDLRLVSTITTLGTPLDVTLQELRIETFFPADEATQRQLQALANSV